VTIRDQETALPLHRNRDFALLWVGAAFSVLIYPMLVLWSGGSRTTAGLAGFAALLPQLAIQLPAGRTWTAGTGAG
jgi:hypothetical protein